MICFSLNRVTKFSVAAKHARQLSLVSNAAQRRRRERQPQALTFFGLACVV